MAGLQAFEIKFMLEKLGLMCVSKPGDSMATFLISNLQLEMAHPTDVIGWIKQRMKESRMKGISSIFVDPYNSCIGFSGPVENVIVDMLVDEWSKKGSKKAL